MAFQGFGKNSGPSAAPTSQNPFPHFPRPPSPTPPFSASHLNDLPGATCQYCSQELEAPERTYSPPSPFQSSRFVMGPAYPSSAVLRPIESSPKAGDTGQKSFYSGYDAQTHQRPSAVTSFLDSQNSGAYVPAKITSLQDLKRTRPPQLLSTVKMVPSDSPFNDHRQAVPQRPRPPSFFPENYHSVDNFGPFVETQRTAVSPPVWGNQVKLPSNFSNSWTRQDQPAVLPYDSRKKFATKNVDAQAPKRTRSPPIPSADEVSQENSHFSRNDSKRPSPSPPRLGTRSNNLSKAPDSETPYMPLPSARTIDDKTASTKPTNFPVPKRTRSPPIPVLYSESERAEGERKGDLDQYERLDGDRNQTSKSLAVKKYTRTAEREADLIRPMPILQMTIDYLLMRAIRMDLRMQHIFNLDAITMLEQMIRLHIVAMHELCEYTKGEGFSEGFDAHLNIEQMNKTSVELFQLYDDHRKKGMQVPTEKEFRGYYALLKLDKHPGYKVYVASLAMLNSHVCIF
ncbi:hypothetical protein TEA_026127 [Camellia sinensis var. sinensis]|uniref:SAC3/GANP/THP3 conserved domain-containing protein n=1 Tax=Camellia sinensis var. sinensis TaxID=542762 RepID=A0A4S4EAW9_CAMSN|nr:hypothetical protein TEA_026127 [Camellia sinensis var. sinensis]